MRNRFLLFLLTCIIFGACKESFMPEVTSSNSNLLVVEGFINTGADSTIIKLSRTVVVGDKNTLANPETGATVTVESEANEIYNLPELLLKKGTYASVDLNLNSNKKYRLKIKTTKGATYVSDFVVAKVSPPIDDVNWEVKNNDVQVSVNTHDVANMSRYYRWEYIETYIFYSKFRSTLKWDGTNLVARYPPDMINQCWGNSISSTILLGSSAKLDQDVIFKSPINAFPLNSELVSEKYSILVKQYVLTKEAYDFWERLKKNTESLGSIFDAQPSQLVGNIHNVANVLEPVIGYIGAGTVQQKRIYIQKTELPFVRNVYPYDCDEPYEYIPKQPGDLKLTFESGLNVPIEYSAKGIYTSSRECVDCTVRGVTKQPSFWQ